MDTETEHVKTEATEYENWGYVYIVYVIAFRVPNTYRRILLNNNNLNCNNLNV